MEGVSDSTSQRNTEGPCHINKDRRAGVSKAISCGEWVAIVNPGESQPMTSTFFATASIFAPGSRHIVISSLLFMIL